MVARSRFTKKFPRPLKSTSADVSLSHVLVALFRTRAGLDSSASSSGELQALSTVTTRLVHIFAQHAEFAVSSCTVFECPDATVREKMHPFLSASRKKGNPTLKMHTVSQFVARGGGFVSTKDETQLHKLGIVSKDSPFGSRTGSEYCVRNLMKTVTFFEQHLQKQDMKVVNFTFDAATVSGEHVSRNAIDKLVWQQFGYMFAIIYLYDISIPFRCIINYYSNFVLFHVLTFLLGLRLAIP